MWKKLRKDDTRDASRVTGTTRGKYKFPCPPTPLFQSHLVTVVLIVTYPLFSLWNNNFAKAVLPQECVLFHNMNWTYGSAKTRSSISVKDQGINTPLWENKYKITGLYRRGTNKCMPFNEMIQFCIRKSHVYCCEKRNLEIVVEHTESY